jgi:hypothetical protein
LKKKVLILLPLVAILIVISLIVTKKEDRWSSFENSIVNDFQNHLPILSNVAEKALSKKEDSHYESKSYDPNDSDLKQLFALGYHSVNTADNSFVYFIKDSYFGFTQGLAFSKEGNKPSSPYFTNIRVLDSHWYMFKSK